ncbi:Cdc6/Cdc18 family protein [Natrarchaeobius chitinivorans]|uniref:AAA family ATPase n=1 Tax=Natrarchaeobius chitinivorans TaxID=1679083 RepID=A0A3N6M9G9_NATCH|nr:AAA family ATPase [Natrarchaeobius chitinivorans]RQG92071.1 AAA family ATPase [Natrarchaeobius chitinivorans]
MDLSERIDRRRAARDGGGIVVDREYLSPVVHPTEPVGRGPVLEQLLDALEPVFDGTLPEPVAVTGPTGSGTSAVVVALFAAMNDRLGGNDRSIRTATRADRTDPVTWFVYVDARRIQSEFALYRTILSVLSAEPIPESGIGTGALRDRLRERLARHDRRAVVAIDHHDEPETLSYERAREYLEPVADDVSTVAVGCDAPTGWGGTTVELSAYRDHGLVDIVTDRVSTGLEPGTLDHESVRELAEWADGNAHDALAGLYGAAVSATGEGADRIEPRHIERAIADVPDGCVHVDRALSLSETRQQVLAVLATIDSTDRPVRDVADEIAAQSSLTAGTVKRFLYELADRGVIERVPLPANGTGRRPSAIERRFPAIVFRSLTPACGSNGA